MCSVSDDTLPIPYKKREYVLNWCWYRINVMLLYLTHSISSKCMKCDKPAVAVARIKDPFCK